MEASNTAILANAALFIDPANGATATVVKASSAAIYQISLDNTANGAATFLRLYNTAATVTVGTTVPDSMIMVPASGTVSFTMPTGWTFDTGLVLSSGTSATLATTTAPSSSFIVRIVYV